MLWPLQHGNNHQHVLGEDDRQVPEQVCIWWKKEKRSL